MAVGGPGPGAATGPPDAEPGTGPAGGDRWRVVLAGVGCATGGALVVHVVTRISLGLAAVVLLTLAWTAFALVVRRLDPDRRAELLHRVRVGAVAGVLATAAYDVARFGVVALAELSFRPFHVFELFGRGLLGDGPSSAVLFAAGTVFHVANGVGFGIAYTLLVRRPSIWTGILWALFLEAAMVIVYPSWLQLQALGEFLTISVLGHFVYGTVLGASARKWVVAP